MNAAELQDELKQLDPRFSLIENPNRPGLSNIFFGGVNYDLPPVSSFDIREEEDLAHTYEFPNGWRAPYYTHPAIIARCEKFLQDFKAGKLSIYGDE